MNKDRIVEFKIGKSKGLFVSVPYQYKNFKVENYHVSVPYLLELDSKQLNSWKTTLPRGIYKYIGLSHQVSLELVEEVLKVPFKDYINMLNEKDITVNYSDNSNFWAVVLTEA